MTKFHLFDATRLLVSITQRYVPETAALLAYFMAKFPDRFDFSDLPELQRLKQLMKRVNHDDFNLILSVMDGLELPAEEVNRKST